MKLDEEKNKMTANVRNLEREIERRKRLIREKRLETREYSHKKEKNKKRIEILKVEVDLNRFGLINSYSRQLLRK